MEEILLIPGYRIDRKLGQGGMATVFLGFEEKLQRPVAVKAMSLGALQDQTLAQRFIREARTAANLVHSNIVSIYDVGESQGIFYMAMEYLPGGSLRERIVSGSLTSEQSLEIVRQVASALAYAHGEGFVHRDIKPENIMFRKDGTPVLADFGIARAVGSATKLTKTGMSIGTPHYMSPEQARGQVVDARSDLYSLGIVLYEMLTGKVPFDAEDSVAIAVKHIQEPIPRLSGELLRYQPLLDRLLAKDPGQRAQNASELLKMLGTVMEQTTYSIPVAAVSERVSVPTPPPPAVPSPQERPTRVASAEEMAPFLSGAAQKSGPNKVAIALVALLAVLVVAVIILLLPSKKEKVVERMPGETYSHVFWTRSGTKYHLYSDCQRLAAGKTAEIFEGTAAQARELKNISGLCNFCEKRFNNESDAELHRQPNTIKEIRSATHDKNTTAGNSQAQKIEITSETVMYAALPDVTDWQMRTPYYSKGGFRGMETASLQADYDGPGGDAVRYQVTDTGTASALLAPLKLVFSLNMRVDDQDVMQQTSTVNGIPVVERIDKRSGESTLGFISKDRYLIELKTGSANGIELLREFAAAINLTVLP